MLAGVNSAGVQIRSRTEFLETIPYSWGPIPIPGCPTSQTFFGVFLLPFLRIIIALLCVQFLLHGAQEAVQSPGMTFLPVTNVIIIISPAVRNQIRTPE